ncbi:MAG: B12-binding domain-containing radical SAM protein [Deltaproteobacteria bacterium]|nr:B12-binding domain-containing radical SAM protein [Deltaproteobacteria bacterium]
MRVLFVIPPLYLWNYIPAAEDNFLTPLGLVYLASALKQRFGRDVDVRIIDCSAEHIGWRTLEQRMRGFGPAVVVTTFRDTFNAPDHGRVAELARAIDPAVVVLAGGIHASELPEDTMTRWPIDVVALQEGEETICELVEQVGRRRRDFSKVKGIVYREGDRFVRTAPRPLIEDLSLFSPSREAYDLLPMHLYRPRYMWGGTTVEGSRGCIGHCKFCSFWSFMSRADGEGPGAKRHPCLRIRPVGQVLDQLELLNRHYGKEEFFWVDPTFGVDPKWTEELLDGIERRRIRMKFSAFMRSDMIVRDERLGLLQRLVDAGLWMTLVGVERASDEDMKWLDKSTTAQHDIEAFRILRTRYPQVVRMALCMIGLPWETRETMRQLGEYLASDLDVDVAAPHPITPFPGTELWRSMPEEWRKNVDFRDVNMIYPVIPVEGMTPTEICLAGNDIQKKLMLRLRHLPKVLSRHERQRSTRRHFWLLAGKILYNSIRHRENPYLATRSTWATSKPPWYDI